VRHRNPLSGVTGEGDRQMTTKTLTAARDHSDILGIGAALLAGLMLLFVAGISHASVLHAAAHDQRHAIAFPCH
jgi:cobalt transporter subunit CbtB